MISAYLVDTVTLKSKTLDKWGEPSYSSTTLKARVEKKNRMIRDFSGNEVVSMTKVIMAYRSINQGDELTIDGKDYGILNIVEQKDFSSKYLEVYLG